MAFIDFDNYYTPSGPRWDPEDGTWSSIGTSRLFFRRVSYYLDKSYDDTIGTYESEEGYKKGE